MDKKIILKNYLNTINLGNNTLGVKAAALRYFDKDVSDLTLSEATVIAGITQNPSRFNPLSENGRKRNEEKRRVILQYMYEQGMISKDDQEEALADDVYSRIKNVDIVTKETQTPYSYFTDELIDQVLKACRTRKATRRRRPTISSSPAVLRSTPPRIRISSPWWMKRSADRKTTTLSTTRSTTVCRSSIRTRQQRTIPMRH